MKAACRACLIKGHMNSSPLLTVLPEFEDKSILDLLNIVTSSKVPYSETWPSKICWRCLNNLKNAYKFIILFKNSQTKLNEKIKISIVDIKKETKVDKNLDLSSMEETTITNRARDMCIEMVPVNVNIRPSENSNYSQIKQEENIVPFAENVNAVTNEPNNSDIKEEYGNYFNNVNEGSEVFQDRKEKNNVFYKCEKDKFEPNENKELDEKFKLDVCQIEKNKDKNISNIQIATTEGILSRKRLKGDKKILETVFKSLKSRAKTKKIETDNTSKDIQVYKCSFCERTFDSPRKLTMHKKRMHNCNRKEKFKCSICEELIKTASALNIHMAKHNQKHSCNQCDKSYPLLSTLKEHIKIVHENRLKFLCTECGRGFKYLTAFKYHKNKHSNSRDFVCRECGESFIVPSSLKRHERIHTGERPYACKYCTQTFKGSSERNRHEDHHEGVFRYSCKYCDKPFVKNYNMKLHSLNHGGLYVCEMCNKNFADSDILEFHYGFKHKIKDVDKNDAEKADVNIEEPHLVEDKNG